MTDERPTNRGFTLIELLIVVAIISLMAAVALPAIARYVRMFQIRGAVQQVTGEIQAARNKAIMKNVNLGLVFVVLSPTTYRYVIEDDQATPKTWSVRQPVANLLPAGDAPTAQASALKTLPAGIQFGTNGPPAGCTGMGGAPNNAGFRFSKLGAWCEPTGTAEPCPGLGAGVGQTFVFNDSTTGATLCLIQPSTGLRRRILVAPGGRVMAPEAWN